jgi:hypothetical protein
MNVAAFVEMWAPHAGAGWAPSPWQAVQQAARDAVTKLETGEAAPRDWTAMDDAPR